MSYLKTVIFRILEAVLRLLYILPVDKNKVVFHSTNGDRYNCNPKYISEYIIKNCPDEFKVVWVFNKPGNYAFLKNQGITVCKSNSPSAIYNLITAKFIIDNIFPVSYIPYRKSQCVINTWHGGGSYKKGDVKEPSFRVKHSKKMVEKIDYKIFSCERYRNRNLKDGVVKKESVLPFGTARNDMFFGDTSYAVKKVKDYYNIPQDTGFILYAPTFRVVDTDDFGLDLENAVKACREYFKKDFVFAYRMHKIHENDYNVLNESSALCINDYEDTQELIAAADVIITDYSSIIWDAAVAKKPCFLFVPDLEEYVSRVGFDVPISEWPFPLAKTNGELYRLITDFDEEDYLVNCEAHLKALGSYETGHSAEKTVEFMKKQKEVNG